MPKLLPYHRFENFLEPELASGLYNYAIHNREKFKASTVILNGSSSLEESFRTSQTLMDLGEFREAFVQCMEANLENIFKLLQINPIENVVCEVQMASHGNGAFFKPHYDTKVHKSRNTRLVSAVYYFYTEPKCFEGGELVLYPFDFLPGDDTPVTLEPLNNSLVVFPSTALHEVLEVKMPVSEFEGNRFSINCWLSI